jgi:aminocarboxymuconate-semialdehyde decarboxylase
VVQYTFDSTLCMGSLMWSGVLDRFPRLQFILSHGGGALPYLMGRFDTMDQRSDHHHTGIVSQQAPSAYAKRLHYDTILHSPSALRWLAQEVGVERLLLGTDDGFPPADRDPLASLKNAGFAADDVRRIADENPRRLFGV